MDDTARMAKCLKVTDPRALTLAYKMPLAGMECEWRLLGGAPGAPGQGRGGQAPGKERNCGSEAGPVTRWPASPGSLLPPPPLQAQ